MIYLDISLEEAEEKTHLEIDKNKKCVHYCGKTMSALPIRTKDSIGFQYVCECGSEYYNMRAYTKEAIDFWNNIV